ncbi:thioredoxin family protein [Butyricimonas faecalis]|jgi:hypothetical protein|uniref:DUF255 domain-containing protein n=1 Tax=Butyricimonas faecalis TaxID=2093856 RepID=A0A3Q9IP77_9BACT|nr:DUF255 domain-containing protein [Butyricimonas faecalis]AZS28651.1 DUF255 domain-containing protein [Butyricimonas faecalis]MBS7154007.1 DUF255 domain-containing protein [Sanguibacteroides justesenii]
MISRIILAALFIISSNVLFGQEEQDGIHFMDNQPWQEVLKQAKEQNKMIFMDCYTVWCGPCKVLAKEIFSQKKVGDFFNAHFVNVKYDMEKGDGKMLQKKYEKYIIGYPSMLLINSDGEVIHQMAGFHVADELIAGMKGGLEGKTLFVLREKYERGERDFETVRDYVDALNGAFLRGPIKKIVTDYVETIPVEKLLDPAIWKLVGAYITDPETDAYEFILNQIEKFQFQLNVDRYKLERQLKSGMVQVMKELTKKTICVNDIDSLDVLRAKIERFRGMLQTNIVKGFPTLLCELEIINSRLDNDVDMMSKLLDFGNRLNLLKNESRFVVNSYRYIATQTKNKNKLNQILNLLIELQEEQNKSTAKLLNYNYYDVIAFVYEKLGQKKNAEKAMLDYEQLEKVRSEEVHSIIKK